MADLAAILSRIKRLEALAADNAAKISALEEREAALTAKLDDGRRVLPSPDSSTPPPTCLAKPWRISLLIAGSMAPTLYLVYALTGDHWWSVLGGTTTSFSAGCMGLFYFSSLAAKEQDLVTLKNILPVLRGDPPLLILCFFMLLGSISYGVGNLHTDPAGEIMVGIFAISTNLWFSPCVVVIMGRINRILCQMTPAEITEYLTHEVLVVGISSLVPMLYLGLDTLKCLIAAAPREDEIEGLYIKACGQTLVPQTANCFFLLVLMCFKILVFPLSPMNLSTDDPIRLRLPRRIIFSGAVTVVAFLLNLYMFANMDDGQVSDDNLFAFFLAIPLTGLPLLIELAYFMYFHNNRLRSDTSSSTVSSNTAVLQNGRSIGNSLTRELGFI